MAYGPWYTYQAHFLRNQSQIDVLGKREKRQNIGTLLENQNNKNQKQPRRENYTVTFSTRYHTSHFIKSLKGL